METSFNEKSRQKVGFHLFVFLKNQATINKIKIIPTKNIANKDNAIIM